MSSTSDAAHADADTAAAGTDSAERFPFTKFLPPAVDTRVAQWRVAQLARLVHDHRLVVVRAPAGSGKTTLLAAWAAQASVPVAWLRIDAGDVDGDILATALHATVARLTGRHRAMTPRG